MRLFKGDIETDIKDHHASPPNQLTVGILRHIRLPNMATRTTIHGLPHDVRLGEPSATQPNPGLLTPSGRQETPPLPGQPASQIPLAGGRVAHNPAARIAFEKAVVEENTARLE